MPTADGACPSALGAGETQVNIFRLLTFIATHPLNRDKPLRAIGRFVRWQTASRLVPGPIQMPFVEGTSLMVRRGMTGATGNWYCGLHEPDEMSFVLHALRPGELFADIGANVGSYTVLAGGVVGAEVITAEPLPATFERLTANIRVNALEQRVEAHCCGLSDRAGQIEFTEGLDTMNRVARPDEDLPTRKVPVLTLDALCGERRPAIIKIDVEGHELPVLDGARQVLASDAVEAVLMETNGSGERYGVGDDVIIARLRDHGFTPCRYDWRTRSVRPVERGGSNTIFVRNPAAMEVKCRAAPQRRLVNGAV